VTVDEVVSSALHHPDGRIGDVRLGWQDDALCAQVATEAFFPLSGGQDAHRAKKVCAECPVRIDCLTYALQNDIRQGIWGGTSPNERRRMARSVPRVSPHGRHPWSTSELSALRKLHDAGASDVAIGRVLNRPRESVRAARRRLGLAATHAAFGGDG
jgi:WhiB family transcriptional regulator, redox-sensing transcriptional regulator